MLTSWPGVPSECWISLLEGLPPVWGPGGEGRELREDHTVLSTLETSHLHRGGRIGNLWLIYSHLRT